MSTEFSRIQTRFTVLLGYTVSMTTHHVGWAEVHQYPGASLSWSDHFLLMQALSFLAPFLVLILLWSFFWKGLALWHSARRGQYGWFAVILVVNTVGILEIIYLFFVAKLKWSELFSLHRSHKE